MMPITACLLVRRVLTASLLTGLACTFQVHAEQSFSVEEEKSGAITIQTLSTQDRFGKIEERRVKGMYSEIRYVPTGGTEGYQLIGGEGNSRKTRSTHHESNELLIPSWNVFTW